MLAPDLLTGASTMPAGTICLTYDDGPGQTPGEGRGPRTLPLAQYLAAEGIRATFFMCGVHVAQMPDAPARVRALGHLVGNHTWHHWHLPEVLAAGGDVVGRARGDGRAARPAAGRAGLRATAVRALVAAGRRSGQRGPRGERRPGRTGRLGHRRGRLAPLGAPGEAQEAAAALVDAVEEVGRGILLMHDSTADLPDVRAGNAAYETTMLLVPELRRRGYGSSRWTRSPCTDLGPTPLRRRTGLDSPHQPSTNRRQMTGGHA